jgi:hypothetical protein
MVCNSANRDVAVDNFGACGSKVLIVNKMNVDAYVISGIDVILVNWSEAMLKVAAPANCRKAVRGVQAAARGAQVCAVTGHRTIVSTAPRLRHDAFALGCKALIYSAAQGVRASAEPARSSVARPARAP